MGKFQQIAVIVALFNRQCAVIMHIRAHDKLLVGTQIFIHVIDFLILGERSPATLPRFSDFCTQKSTDGKNLCISGIAP